MSDTNTVLAPPADNSSSTSNLSSTLPPISGGIVSSAGDAANVVAPSGPPAQGTPLPAHQTRLGAILSAVSHAMSTPLAQKIGTAVVNGVAAGAAQRGSRSTFLSGMAAGAQKQLDYQFESVQAADSHRKALDEHNRAEQLSEDDKLQYKQNQANYQAYMQDNFGIAPDLTFNDDATSATAALGTLSERNGGKVPAITTSQQPDVQGTHGRISVYSPTQQQMIDNQKGFREIINTQRDVQGLKPIDDATFNSLGFKGQLKAFQDAQQFLSPTPSFSDKEKLPVMIAQRKQQLDAYVSKHTVNGEMDAASTKTAAILKSGVSYLQNSYDQASKTENQNAANAASVKAQAEQDVKNSPTNQAAEAKAAGLKAAAELPYKEAQEKFAQQLKDGKPEDVGALLVDGDVAPSQIISARNPSFAQQAFAAAKAYAKANGKDWNAQEAEGYFKSASNQGNVQFFGSAKSLTDKDGTLDQLTNQYKNLPANSKLPSINGAINWVTKQIGGRAPNAFEATAIGVADDYAKVMGGGVGSDTSRQQIIDSINAAQSPQQAAAVVDAIRKAVASQMNSRIGTNPVMRRMYGTQLGSGSQAPTVGQPHDVIVNGVKVGVTTDGGKTMTPVQGR